jgi:hypothetical protein
MPTKKDPRDKTGTIIHAVTNRVLSDHTAKNIYGNVNYCKYFMQGTVVDVFNGRAPGGKNAIWKLMVDFEMPSDESGLELKRFVVNQQHCTLGPVPVGKNPQCSVTFTDLIGDPNHAMKGLTTYLPNAKERAAAASAVAAATTTNDGDDDNAAAAAPRISLSPAPVDNKIEVILLPPTPPPPPVGKTATKKKRKKAAALDDALTATPQLPTAPAGKKSKATKKKKAAKPVNLCASPMWVLTTDLKKHRVVAIAHEQKWVVGNADTITGDVANEPSSNHQWSYKRPFGERIAGNPESLAMSRHLSVYDPISGAHVVANNVCDDGPDDDGAPSSHPASPLFMMDEKILMEYGPYRDLVSRRDALYLVVGMLLAPDVAKDVAEGLVNPR